MLARLVDKAEIRTIALLAPIAVVVLTCGPPLTDPASQNVTGRWTGTDHIGPIYDIVMDLTESTGANVSGQWTSKVSPLNPPCPPELSSAPVAPVTGTNTVIGVSLSLVGAGEFRGQIISATSMRGSFESCGGTYSVSFTMIGPTPGG